MEGWTNISFSNKKIYDFQQWLKTAGWHKYSGNGDPQPVQHPPDDALIFDVEVLMSAGKRPTLACALSTEAWYVVFLSGSSFLPQHL